MSALEPIRAGYDKLAWGSRAVGPLALARGAIRSTALRVRRPSTATVRLRTGMQLRYEYPAQYAPALVLFGDLIDPEYPFLRRVLRPDSTVVDVGAAIGQFTVFCALQPCAHVHAYEPVPANVETLRSNVVENGVADRVTIHEVALAGSTGSTTFEAAGRTYLSRIEGVDDVPTDVEAVTVPVRRFDDERARLGLDHVDVLKVNVAGAEPAVLDGARATLEQGAVDIVIALLGVESFDWYAQLREFGYRLCFYHPREGVLHSARHTDARLLDERPWPARHLLAIREDVIASDHVGPVRVQP